MGFHDMFDTKEDGIKCKEAEAAAVNVTPVIQHRVNMVNGQRVAIKKIAKDVLDLKQHFLTLQTSQYPIDSEVFANLMLAYRHMEDASMRLGKAIQYLDGGVSVYDKKTTVGCKDVEDQCAGA